MEYEVELWWYNCVRPLFWHISVVVHGWQFSYNHMGVSVRHVTDNGEEPVATWFFERQLLAEFGRSGAAYLSRGRGHGSQRDGRETDGHRDGQGIGIQGDGQEIRNQADGIGIANQGESQEFGNQRDGQVIGNQGDGQEIGNQADGQGIGIQGDDQGIANQGDGQEICNQADGLGIANQGDRQEIDNQGDGQEIDNQRNGQEINDYRNITEVLATIRKASEQCRTAAYIMRLARFEECANYAKKVGQALLCAADAGDLVYRTKPVGSQRQLSCFEEIADIASRTVQGFEHSLNLLGLEKLAFQAKIAAVVPNTVAGISNYSGRASADISPEEAIDILLEVATNVSFSKSSICTLLSNFSGGSFIVKAVNMATSIVPRNVIKNAAAPELLRRYSVSMKPHSKTSGGFTTKTLPELLLFISQLKENEFTPEKYAFFSHNCRHFANALVHFLTGDFILNVGSNENVAECVVS